MTLALLSRTMSNLRKNQIIRISGSGALRKILKRLATTRAKTKKTEVEQAVDINIAIPQHKPQTFLGAGEPAELVLWLHEFE